MNNKQRNPAPKASVPVPEECAPQNEDLKIIYWPIEKFVHYARNPRKNECRGGPDGIQPDVQILAEIDHFLINLWN
jgi:hypothetical protein